MNAAARKNQYTFRISAALERIGAIDALARVLMQMAGHSEARTAVARARHAAAFALVNHLPAVGVFVPVVLVLARNTDAKASRLLIPLSYFSILGSTITLSAPQRICSSTTPLSLFRFPESQRTANFLCWIGAKVVVRFLVVRARQIKNSPTEKNLPRIVLPSE